jgi:lipid-A-disaccharide synthase
MKIFIVAGEESGDQLGAPLMRALRVRAPQAIFAGVGGDAMEREGLKSLFPLRDIAVMGFVPVLKKLPTLLERIDRTASAALEFAPDLMIVIDSPDFTHRVAKKVRAKAPAIPIVDYVCPSVWAWRPGRAKTMRRHFDRVLCLLPFEPAALERLGGPPGTYVGHPLIERAALLTPTPADEARRAVDPPLLALLPGSRRSELDRLMPVFRDTVAALAARAPGLDVALPAVRKHVSLIERMTADWPVKPRLVHGEAYKYETFRRARAALAASGTVTLELALARVPSVVAYKVSKAEEFIARRLVVAPSIVLPNLILGENVYPEFIQDDCAPQNLADATMTLFADGPARAAQLAGLAAIAERMRLPQGRAPSDLAAETALATRRL